MHHAKMPAGHLVSDNSSQKQLKNLRLQDEQNNELKALIS